MTETTEPAAEAAPIVTIDAPKADAPAAEAAPKASSRFSFKPKLSRVGILTIAIAASAAIGSVVGALAGAAIVRSGSPDLPTASATLSKGTLSLLSADIAALKASIETGNKEAKARAAQLSERIERAEKAAADPAKFAKLNETIDRLEKKSAAPADVTGSIAAKDQMRAPVVSGWVLRDIYDGRATIESREGLFEVGPGSNIPGLGRIEAIRRQDGRWVVVTPRGMIVSSR
jgi:hypothetical protein